MKNLDRPGFEPNWSVVPMHMRAYVQLLYLFIICSCSVHQKMDGTYFSYDQDAIIVSENKGLIEAFGKAPEDGLKVKHSRYQIKFKQIRKGRIPIIQRHGNRYNFRILSSDDDVFMLSPKSRRSKAYFENRDSIKFLYKYKFLDKNIRLEKIIFHSSRCYGLCPDFSLEVDSSGKMRMTNRGNGIHGANLNENYIGKLSANQIEKLGSILSLSHLRTLKWAPRMCCDGPIYTMIIYYNGRKLYLRSMWTPVVSWDLVGFLRAQFANKTFQKVDTAFAYER